MSDIKLIVFLILLGGVIAYLGDLLGRRAGKKKISVLGLRPKYSAVVITVISGILIVALTLLTLSFISQEVRIALFGVQKLQSDLLRAKKEVENVSTKLSNLSKEIRSREKKLISLRNDLKKVETAKEKITEELIVSHQEEIKLRNIQKELNSKIEVLVKQKIHLEEKVESLRGQGEEVFGRLKKAQTELIALDEEKRKIDEEKKKIEIKLKETKVGKIIIPAGYELISLPLDISLLPHKMREEILHKLWEINQWAQDRGAKSKERGEVLVVWETQLENLLEDIVNRKTSVVVRFLSFQNTIEGEPLYIKFEVIENKIIIKKGETLSEGIISPEVTQQEIEKKLLLLLKEARENVLSRGLKVEPGGEIGGISALKFYNIVGLIRKSPVELKASVITTKDVYIVDTLEVDFRIKETKE